MPLFRESALYCPLTLEFCVFVQEYKLGSHERQMGQSVSAAKGAANVALAQSKSAIQL